jgi:hypothetical protein
MTPSGTSIGTGALQTKPHGVICREYSVVKYSSRAAFPGHGDPGDSGRTYISALERSVYAASIDVVGRLAKELGVEASDLLLRHKPLDTRQG